jgi:hypothetical protein
MTAMPTHSQFARAAAASRKSDRSTTSAQPAAAEPPIRKYIVVERDGQELAITFPSCVRHDEACPQKAGRLVSAGSYGVANGRVVLTGMGSGTLNLPSRPADAALIESLFSES